MYGCSEVVDCVCQCESISRKGAGAIYTKVTESLVVDRRQKRDARCRVAPNLTSIEIYKTAKEGHVRQCLLKTPTPFDHAIQ